MGIFDSLDRFTDRLGRAIVGKQNLSGPSMVPPEVTQSFYDNGMTSATPLGPGSPIPPAFGYNLEPRQFDYTTGQNINNRPRHSERISFATLKALVDSYDVAQLCILHRISSIRALPWKITPLDGYVGEAVEQAIRYAKNVLEFPDHELPFDSWLSKFLWDVLAYDAGCLYRMRDSFGNVVGLDVVDGTTIAPMIDQYGRRPLAPAPAFVQFVQGLGTVQMDATQLVYLPYTPISHSLYGRAPIETILLNANTDMRFQAFFMQRFTEGNIPAMFAVAPETWTPEQILGFQATWDALMKGDQAANSQIKWVPGGTSFQDMNDANAKFNKDMADLLLRKTAAAYHVTPADLGFTDSVNRSSGETQADVQERTADRPLTGYVGGILSRFLQQDLHLPLQFEFILDSDDDDGLATAQSDGEYIKMGVVSASEVREMRFGKTDPSDEVVPRFVFTNTNGPVPLSTLMAASTQIDPETALPMPMSTVPAEETAALPVGESVGGKGSGPAGIPESTPAEGAFKSELATFNRYVRKIAKSGRGWRDFTFNSVPSKLGRELNRAGRSSLAKDGEVIAAGLLVYAIDTGRVLMLQRALDDADPASGTWEFPGGHIEAGERPLDAAFREWQEEVGCVAQDFTVVGSWDSGVYQGFVATVASESLVPCRIGSTSVLNPDDPDGDNVETVAWWDPAMLGGNPMLRQELALSLPLVFAALSDALASTAQLALPAGADADPLVRTGGNAPDGLAVKSKAAGETGNGISRSMGRTDIRTDGVGDVASSGNLVSPLADRVGDVIGVGSQEQMRGVHAGGNVARVADEHPSRDESVGKLIGESVSGHGDIPGDVEHPVAASVIDSGRPYPAPAGHDDVAPESVRDTHSLHGSSIRKNWRDSAPKTPQHEFDLKITDHYAPIIAGKLRDWLDALPIEEVASKLAAQLPVVKADGDPSAGDLKGDALAQFQKHAMPDLDGTLSDISRDGWTAGEQAAAQQIAGHKAPVAGVSPATVAIDWDDWVPGNPPSAAKIAADGLKSMLADQGVTLKGITDTALDQIGNMLADGLLAGDSIDSMSKSIRDAVGDPTRAEKIAHTETTRAVIGATFDVYQSSGVTQWDFVLSDGACPECEDAASANPHDGFDLDSAPPIHPYCRCAASPIASTINADSIQTIEPDTGDQEE